MTRFGRLFLIILLLMGLLLATTGLVCGEEEEIVTDTIEAVPEENGEAIIAERALEVLATTPPGGVDYTANSIFGVALAEKLADPAEAENIYILDIRDQEDFDQGHIEGAVRIDFQDWAEPETLAMLPEDDKIIVVGYRENTEAQVVMGLRMLGFDAAIIRGGMSGWAQTPQTQETVADLADTNLPVVAGPPDETAAPAPENGPLTQPSDDDYDLIADKAAEVMRDMPMTGDFANYSITAPVLYEKLSGDEAEDLFLLDIRGLNEYELGHIEGAVNIPFRAGMVPENLEMLPKDKTIVVICYTANTAAQLNMMLRMLDYDAVVLDYAMMAWDGSGKEGYLNDIQAANNPVVVGVS